MRIFVKYDRDTPSLGTVLSREEAADVLTFNSPAQVSRADACRWLDVAPSGRYVQVGGYHLVVLDQTLDDELPLLSAELGAFK